ncbi:MAG: DUF1569 domain-containing protein [Vicinamibacteria bacterium]|jgi:hypothetical protein|nr:DUF1569 domain-containing protein [Vicinamibacteria bacterium]
MKTIHDEATRAEVLARVARLRADGKALWGRFDASRMVCHLIDALEMANGQRSVRLKPLWPMRHFPLKHLVLYVLPFPKGAPTAPELLSTAPAPSFDADRSRLVDLVHRFAAMPQTGPGATHPLFGKLDQAEWGALVAKHLDHHLRQFGA